MANLSSVVFRLKTKDKILIPAYLGREIQKTVLELLSERNAAWAAAIHDSDQSKPLTCSNLIGGTITEKGQRLLLPDDTVCFRVTGLTEVSTQYLLSLTEIRSLSVKLCGTPMVIEDVTADPDVHYLARVSSYEKLTMNVMNRSQPPSEYISFLFLSPTTFRQGRKKQSWPVPLPKWVFGSLHKRWNRFGPLSFSDELLSFIDEYVVITSYRLSTKAVPTKANIQPGFTGRVTYCILKNDLKFQQQLLLLSHFAFYAGIGYQTTTGMGQARLTRRMESGYQV